MLFAGWLRDFLLPAHDWISFLQLGVIAALTLGGAYLARREREVQLLIIGLGMTILGILLLRTLH